MCFPKTTGDSSEDIPTTFDKMLFMLNPIPINEPVIVAME